MCAANIILRRLGNAPVANLSLTDQCLHYAGNLLDWNLGIDAVLIVEIDVIRAQPAQ